MKYKNTDRIIAEKYKKVESDFDAEGAWKELENEVKHKKRRGFWLWYIIGISLVGFLSYNQISIKNGTSERIFEQTVNEQNKSLIAEITNISTKDRVEVQSEVESEFAVTAQSSVSLDIHSEQKILRENSGDLVNQSRTVLEQSNAKIEDETSLKLPFEEDLVAYHASSTLAVQKINEKGNRNIKSIELLSIELMGLELDRHFIPLADVMPLISLIPSTQKNIMRLGVYGGYFIHSRSLKHSGVGSSENYNSRVEEEKAMDAFDFGLKLDYFINDNLVVFGGIRYDQSYVERNADYVYLESITLPDHTILIIETDEGTIEKTGNITYDGYYHHKSNNYLTSKRMGILAGMQYRIGTGKWITHLDFGLELPVWSSLSGIITHNGKPFNLSDGDLELNHRRILLFGGVGAEYSLSDGLGLQFMIGGYLPTSNEYKESYNITKKSIQLGVNLGLHFQL